MLTLIEDLFNFGLIAEEMTLSQPVFQKVEPHPDITFQSTGVWISQAEAIEMSHLLTYSMAPPGYQ